MAGSVNKVILVGNLGADPEVRRTQDGRPIVNLRVATSDSWRDKNTGERREKTEFGFWVVALRADVGWKGAVDMPDQPDGAENNNTRQEDHPLWIEERR